MSIATLNSFLANWQEGPERTKTAFLTYKNYLEGKEQVRLEFIPRPGLTYSLRAAYTGPTKQHLLVMVDVIEDEPRWLSICFYADMVSDPEERGDFVPSGLLGGDALCFDIPAWDEELISYVEARMDEAWHKAANYA